MRLTGNCQARVRSPKVQSPKVKTKRTWADSIITCANSNCAHPAKKIDQVDSEIKDSG